MNRFDRPYIQNTAQAPCFGQTRSTLLGAPKTLHRRGVFDKLARPYIETKTRILEANCVKTVGAKSTQNTQCRPLSGQRQDQIPEVSCNKTVGPKSKHGAPCFRRVCSKTLHRRCVFDFAYRRCRGTFRLFVLVFKANHH